MKEQSPVSKLREIPTPSFPAQLNTLPSGWVEYSGNGHSNRAKGLLSEAGISVAQWFNSKDYEFPIYSIKQKMYIIVYKGCMKIVEMAEDEKAKSSSLLKEGDFIYLEPGIKRKVCFPEDCWYIAATVPQSFDWPI